MHIHSIFGYLALVALPVLAQPLEKTVTFRNAASGQQAAEITTLIRAISETSPVANSGGLMLRGNAEQIELAEWLMAALDRVPDGPAPQAANLAQSEFHLSTGPENVVRVMYLAWANAGQDLAEVSTIVRAIGDMRRVFTVNAMRAVVLRGTAEQIAMADWLLSQLAPYGVRAPEFQLSKGDDRIIRVVHGDFITTPQQLAEASTLLRGITDIRRVFAYNRGRLSVVRGTADQMVVAEWLYKQLAAKPRERAVLYAGAVPDIGSGPAAAVADRFTLFFTPVTDRDALEKAAIEVRTGADVPRVFTYTPVSALAVRGTAAQLATVDRILKEKGY